MKTIERNFKKHPHTARFLQTFHTAVTSAGVDHRATRNVAAADEDLLASIPVEAPIRDARSPRQAELMGSLLAQLADLDDESYTKAVDYTLGMTEHGLWTPGREGNASAWISRMIAKVSELKAAVAAKPTTASPEVADGRYAVEEDGVLKFFKVKNGRRPGFVFLDIQASDDWHAVRNVTRIRAVLALISADPHAAMIRYGHELGECGRCGRTLTDEASRAAGIGPVCIDK